MCWSWSEILVSMLVSAAGEWWIDMTEEDSPTKMMEGKKRVEERSISITLTLNARSDPRWIVQTRIFSMGTRVLVSGIFQCFVEWFHCD